MATTHFELDQLAYSFPQAAKLLGVSVSTIERWANDPTRLGPKADLPKVSDSANSPRLIPGWKLLALPGMTPPEQVAS